MLNVRLKDAGSSVGGVLRCCEEDWFVPAPYEKAPAPLKHNVALVKTMIGVISTKEMRYGPHHWFHYD